MPTFLELAQSGAIAPPSIAATMGITCASLEEGKATFVMPSDLSRHANAMGTLHGGVIATLADSALGFAFATTLAEDESFATLDLKINFLRPVWAATLTAVATVVHRGRTTGFVECRVTDERDRLIAHATSSCLTLRGPQAEGRGLGGGGAPVASPV
jgi:uncharacterized protein (TIGR00369 family)